MFFNNVTRNVYIKILKPATLGLTLYRISLTMTFLENCTQSIFNDLIKQNRNWVPQLTKVSIVQSSVFRVQRPGFSVQSPASKVQHPASRVQRPKSSIQTPTSRVQRPESSVQRPLSSVQRPESSSMVQGSESSIKSPALRV